MNMQVTDSIFIERVGAVALVRIENPPVNAASHSVRKGLMDALSTLDTDPEIEVVALYAAGRTFIAGADIREFGKPIPSPRLAELVPYLARIETPVISVLHGTTLGGGFEIALATQARIGIAGLKVGLPEVNLGVLPGAGGTQRTPRLAGIPAALDIITSGRHVSADDALELGLIDRLVEGDPREVALASARDALAGGLPLKWTDDVETVPDDAAIAAKADELWAKHPNLFAPHKCVEAVAASVLPIDQGQARESELFRACMDSPQRTGLIHSFFSQRAVAKIPEAQEVPRDIHRVGVVGGGTMGSGIATSCLLAGLPVTLIEVAQDGLDRGAAMIRKNLDGAVKRGKMTEADCDAAMSQLTPSLDNQSLNDCDLVIEAVFEDMDVKKALFVELDGICKTGAILATNTSYLDVAEIARVTARPQDVLGLHFFSPAHIMKLLEVVVAEDTVPDAVATGFALARKLNKIAVRAANCDGFIGNRILSHYKKVGEYLVMDGATPQQVDQALVAFGFAMGPFMVADLSGLDIGWANRKRLAPVRPENERYIEIADRICEQGWFGKKTGKGFYLYENGVPVLNSDVDQIIQSERDAAGIVARDFNDQEIVDRYMAAFVSEAVRVVEEGVALRPIDVDAVFLNGYGFPRYRGGPLQYADTVGLQTIVEQIERYASEDAHYWQVPALLQKMAAEGSMFSDLNKR